MRIMADRHADTFCGLELAAQYAGVPYATARFWRDRSATFRAMLDDARERAIAKLEREGYRRAFLGSDYLLTFLLKAWNPSRYNRDRLEITGADGGPLVDLTDVQRAAHIISIIRAAGQQQAAIEHDPIEEGEFRELAPPAADYSDLV